MAEDELPFIGAEEDAGEDGAGDGSDARKHWRDWMSGRTGWVVIVVITLLLGVFASILVSLKGTARPLTMDLPPEVEGLAVDMLGHEVAVRDMYQTVFGPGGRRLEVTVDIVLVLGQLPEERVVGAPHPTPEEFEAYVFVVSAMQERVRSRMVSLLQSIPIDEFGSSDIANRIKLDIMGYVNDELEQLSFPTVRPGLGKRRVTDVLLPNFERAPL